MSKDARVREAGNINHSKSDALYWMRVVRKTGKSGDRVLSPVWGHLVGRTRLPPI